MRWPVVAAALIASAAVAHAQPRQRVAVVVDLTANVSAPRATELGAAMAAALERELVIDATGGADVLRRLPPDGVPDDCLATPACLADLGRRLDATELLFLSLIQVGATVQVETTWIHPATGEVRARPRIDIDADARAGEVFAAAAQRLLPDAEHRTTPVAIVPVATPRGPRRHMTPTAWAVAGASLAALGGGVGLGLSARATYQRCDRDPDRCDTATRDGLATRALAADALTAVALIGGGVTAYLYLRSARAPVRAAITPVPAGAMADVRVEF